MIRVPSLNFEQRPEGLIIQHLVFHYTETPTAQEALEILTSPERKVSCHYLLDTDGSLYQVVPEEFVAWHAGVSAWGGQKKINHTSIGIEIQNTANVDGRGYPAFSEAQIEALVKMSRGLIEKYKIEPQNIVGHSDIAPSRKQDPGHHFPWEYLASQGIGHWPAQGRAEAAPNILEAQKLLGQFGYEVSQSGVLDASTREVLTAFQRRFMPEVFAGLDPQKISTYQAQDLNSETYGRILEVTQLVPKP